MKNIIIFGAPGSGKGTYSDMIVEKYGMDTSAQAMYCVHKSRQRPNWARWHRATSTTDSSSPMPS